MTRTERAAHKRALLKDRSESRTGLDKSIRKQGAGAHSWGSLSDELELELAALEDEGLDRQVANEPSPPKERQRGSSVSYTEEEKEQAQNFRATALKNAQALDLAAIARTSNAVSGTSPIRANPTFNNKLGQQSEYDVASIASSY